MVISLFLPIWRLSMQFPTRLPCMPCLLAVITPRFLYSPLIPSVPSTSGPLEVSAELSVSGVISDLFIMAFLHASSLLTSEKTSRMFRSDF